MANSDKLVLENLELKDLIKKRGVIKGKLTSFKKYVSGLTEELSAEQLLELDLRITRMSLVFEEFEIVQTRIETLATDVDNQISERELFEDGYFKNVALGKSIQNVNGSDHNNTILNPSNNESSSPLTEGSQSIKFPEISLPSFNGDKTHWVEFRDSFDALINQSNLKSIQKFKYLKSCLTDSALEVDFRTFLKDQADHLESLDPGKPHGPSDAQIIPARKAFVTTSSHTGTASPTSSRINATSLKIPPRFNLADDFYHEPGEVDMIIGAELFFELLCIGRHRLGDGQPTLQKPRLGWVVTGSIPGASPPPQSVRCNFVSNTQMKSLFDTNEFDSRNLPNDETIQCEKIFNDHTRTSEATRCLTQLANENKGEYPLASAAIQHDFLMDDYVHGDDDERRLAETSVQVDRILSTANFKLRKWKSNSKTILNEVEGILNSRPLCPLPNSDTDEISVLTPAHFLIGRTLISLPDYEYENVPTNRLSHYQQLQQIQCDFWRRWSRDYIGLLQERTKWRSCKGAGLDVGTIVLIKDDRLPPCQWRLGRIVGCCPGRDGITRVAEMRTARGIIKRAFNNICPLPITC
ncbi:unnamed protein product [Plutella xylostella]|uniref:(diamondback moth) hypothetical protein n=1 Tax=Plutella xylostella TaxID=51655 RepID=A0A8S4G860_PLUXY|nr:unnamed protein product [Plutella xylostella]